MTWSPDYIDIFRDRERKLIDIKQDRSLQRAAISYYQNHYIDFIEDWCITIDPRNSETDIPTILPFKLFPIQKDFCKCLVECVENKEHMLCEKSRDMGVTWLACAMSIWYFLFHSDIVIGWASRKEMLVDRLGDRDSIFEKMRGIFKYLPNFLLPADFDIKKHSSHMKIINPENSSIIRGEAGDNIGRGGRSLLVFKDESAHYARPDRIEAALGDNTNSQIDISSVQGTNNIFYQKRMAGEIWAKDKEIKSGVTRIFIMDWQDHPLKDENWYKKRYERAEREGTLHLFAQEVDRDYKASIEGTIIKPEWVDAAIDAHKKLDLELSGEKIAGLDIADEGMDKNAIALRDGIRLYGVKEWSGKDKDVGITAQKAVSICMVNNIKNLQYDSIGVGAGVKAEINRLKRTNKDAYKGFNIVAWNAARSPVNPEYHVVPKDPESPKNKDFFQNLKIQAWWNVRIKFEKTWRSVKNINNEDFKKYPDDELISIDTTQIPRNLLFQLKNELTQPVFVNDFNSGKLRVDKKPDGSKSPNIADAIIMAFYPIPIKKIFAASV